MIYQGATMASLADKAKTQGWTLDKAMSEANRANKISELYTSIFKRKLPMLKATSRRHIKSSKH